MGGPELPPPKISVWGPLKQAQLQGTGKLLDARPAASSFWHSPITASFEPLQGSYAKSGDVSDGGFLLNKGLLVVLLITMLVKRDVENASTSLAGFNTSCIFVLMSVLVSTVSDISLLDNPSISLGDQARVTKGVLNEREVLLDFVSLVYLKWFKQI